MENLYFVEVSGHNLKNSQTSVFCMEFLNHGEGGMGFSGFPLFSFTVYNNLNCRAVRGCVSLRK
jgi:hypothetical protein